MPHSSHSTYLFLDSLAAVHELIVPWFPPSSQLRPPRSPPSIQHLAPPSFIHHPPLDDPALQAQSRSHPHSSPSPSYKQAKRKSLGIPLHVQARLKLQHSGPSRDIRQLKDACTPAPELGIFVERGGKRGKGIGERALGHEGYFQITSRQNPECSKRGGRLVRIGPFAYKKLECEWSPRSLLDRTNARSPCSADSAALARCPAVCITTLHRRTRGRRTGFPYKTMTCSSTSSQTPAPAFRLRSGNSLNWLICWRPSAIIRRREQHAHLDVLREDPSFSRHVRDFCARRARSAADPAWLGRHVRCCVPTLPSLYESTH